MKEYNIIIKKLWKRVYGWVDILKLNRLQKAAESMKPFMETFKAQYLPCSRIHVYAT